MSAIGDILLGLGTALIGYLIGRLWLTFVVRRRFWRAREFWQPVLDGHFQIVISRFAIEGFREPTGVVGGGDAIANRLLGDLFRDIGLERPKSVYVDEAELDRGQNLIVLGGPRENRVALEALARIKPGLSIVDPGPGIPMQVESASGLAQDHDAGLSREVFVADPSPDQMTDYGVILRARNPFKQDRAMVVIQGCYGYGTWAGVGLSQTEEFLRRCEALDADEAQPGSRARSAARSVRRRLGFGAELHPWAQIECLYKVDVIDRRPHEVEIISFRRIAVAI
jgi:hypothetical protein